MILGKKIAFVCNDCGGEHNKWQGQCAHCGAWNTLEEIRFSEDKSSGKQARNLYKPRNSNADKTSIEISYRYFNKGNELISAGYEEMMLSPVPQNFELHQNYPNPFNPITTIRYDLPQEGHVMLAIYDILGREVVKLVNQRMSAGYHASTWDTKDNFGRSISGGIYFYQIQTPGYTKTNKMVLLK